MTGKLIGVPQKDVEDMIKLYEHLARTQVDDGEGRYQADQVKFKANELRKRLIPVNLAPQQANAIWPKVEKPAKVAGTRFGTGVSSRLVVEAAQRLYGNDVTPENEAARIARGGEIIAELKRRAGLWNS